MDKWKGLGKTALEKYKCISIHIWICLQCRRPEFDPCVGKIPWRRERLPTPVFWPGEFQGLYSSWGHKESNTTEQLHWLTDWYIYIRGFPDCSDGKESACNAEDMGSIPGLGRSHGEGKGYPLQDPGLENSMDCMVHGIAKSQALLSDFHFNFSPS